MNLHLQFLQLRKIEDQSRSKMAKSKKKQRRARQKQKLKKRRRSLHKKHKQRRKKDCMIGMPFIIAFTGDPMQLFYCADYPTSFELIPRTGRYPWYSGPFARLIQYLSHWVTQIHNKVLIWKAG